MTATIQSRQARTRTSRAGDGVARSESARAGARVARILDAFREGRMADWTPPASGPTGERVETEEKKTIRMGRLSSADRSALATLSAPREQALALARLGQLDEAHAHMTLARFLLSLSQLSPEGRAYAQTMHEAADAYLSYQRRDYAVAYARMAEALDATERLAAIWGNNEFIVCRRVDLAHNLMRVEMRRGAFREAMQRGERLLRFVYTATVEQARTVSGEPAESPLDVRITTALFDLVMGTVAELVAPLPAQDARALLASLAWVPALDAASCGRAVQWLALKTVALGGDPELFVDAALPFLRAGRGQNPTLWYAVVLDVARLHGALMPAGSSDPLEELVAELSAGPRVPASMRVTEAVAQAAVGGARA